MTLQLSSLNQQCVACGLYGGQSCATCIIETIRQELVLTAMKQERDNGSKRLVAARNSDPGVPLLTG